MRWIHRTPTYSRRPLYLWPTEEGYAWIGGALYLIAFFAWVWWGV